jgi:predicted DCC family thiol-disulfide oxidoreductase YuxK
MKIFEGPIVFYDDQCRFCRYQAQQLHDGDTAGVLAILPFSDPRFRGLTPDLTEEQRLASMHVIGVDGRVHSAGDAVVELLAASPKTRWKARAARLLPPVRRKIGVEYQKLADRRGELSAKSPDVPPIVIEPRAVTERA